MIIIYITCKDKKEAEKISKHLLKKNLIACSNYFPINSMYGWKGKMINDKEFLLLVKTANKNYDAVRKEVRKIHSYEVPCVLRIDVKGNKEFLDWVNKSTI